MIQVLINIAYAVLGTLGLYFGADFLVKGGVTIAKKLGISQIVIGLTLVAMATSAPELVVSLSSAISGNSDISLGNIVGSNITNIGLILGLCTCVTPIAVKKDFFTHDTPVMLGTAVILTIFFYFSHGVTRIQGIILLAILVIYTLCRIKKAKKDGNQAEEEEENMCKTTLSAIMFVLLGFIFLVSGAKLFLWSAVFFAKMIHMSDAVIGLTIVAVGTSLPELATSFVAAVKHKNDIAIGNVVGSNILNILVILGITPVIKPLENSELMWIDFAVMLGLSFILLPFMRTGWKLSRIEGAILLISYIGYTAFLVLKA